MANTTFSTSHTLTPTIWAKELARETIRRTFIGKFIGQGDDALVVEKVDLKKQAGDTIRCGLRMQLSGEGVQGDATLEGNEESMQFFNDSLIVDQLRHAVRINGRMTEQRALYNLRSEAKTALADWYADRYDTAFFNHIAGYTVQTDTKYTGNNAIVAASTNRILRVNGAASDSALTSADTFSLEWVDYARELAEVSSSADSTGPLVRPVMVDGEPMYVMFLHDYQVTDLRTSTSTGQWLDIQRAAMQGGDVSKNPIFTGALGVYNGVVLHKAKRVPQGVNGASAVTTARRAVLCGAGAAMIAYGGRDSSGKVGETKYSWDEELFDYKNQYGVAAGAIWGLKKAQYAPESGSTNQEDYGTIVVSSYAAAHTS